MKAYLLLGIVMLLAGCGGPYMAHVYGKSGTTYTAPSVCAALVQCLKGNETSCFYDRNLYATVAGTEEGGCKEVKK
jgi:hypothetical protein